MFHEILKDVIPMIEVSAPLIASALKYPGFAELKVKALEMINKKFGLTYDDVLTLPKVIKDDSESESKLKSVEDEFSSLIMNSKKEIAISNAKITIEINFDNKGSANGL